MKLFIEFPMSILANYNGASNLDETLDDNISYLIGSYFSENNIEYNILEINFIKPVPSINDEMIQYEIEIGINETSFDYTGILNKLENAGFEKGLTIKSSHKIIFADLYTADIQHRRKLKNIK